MLHGITFAGHPACAAVALKNLEIFQREGVLENVRAREEGLRARLETLSELPVVGDVRGLGFFWAVEFVNGRGDGRLSAEEREALLRGVKRVRILPAEAAKVLPDLCTSRVAEGTEVMVA